jgi:hypothetical protein
MELYAVRAAAMALALFIPWDVCPLGVLFAGALGGDRCTEIESRVVKLGYRLPDLVAESRLVLTEVLDIPLIKNEPGTEGDL